MEPEEQHVLDSMNRCFQTMCTVIPEGENRSSQFSYFSLRYGISLAEQWTNQSTILQMIGAYCKEMADDKKTEYNGGAECIDVFPPILVLQLPEGCTDCHIPVEGLDLSDYECANSCAIEHAYGEFIDMYAGRDSSSSTSLTDIRPIYDLFAVCQHFGSMQTGHYVASTYSPIDGRWYRYSDSNVTAYRYKDYNTEKQNKDDDLLKQFLQNPTPSILFYRRRCLPWGLPHVGETQTYLNEDIQPVKTSQSALLAESTVYMNSIDPLQTPIKLPEAARNSDSCTLSADKKTQYRFTCVIPGCSYGTNRKWNLTSHIKYHEKRRSYKSRFCPYMGKTPQDVASHEQYYHIDMKGVCHASTSPHSKQGKYETNRNRIGR